MSAREVIDPASSRAVLQLPEFRAMLIAAVTSTLASRAVALTVAYQLYQITKNPLTLGFSAWWRPFPR